MIRIKPGISGARNHFRSLLGIEAKKASHHRISLESHVVLVASATQNQRQTPPSKIIPPIPMSFPFPKSLRRLAVIVLLLACSAARAEDTILFLGNSFTYGDGGTVGVPNIFDCLAVAGGQQDPTTVMRAVGGQSFQFHENDATSRSTIASRPWSYVVIQNYSTEPTHIGNPESHHANGTLLYQRILGNHPQTKVILYQTWARAAGHPMISGVSTPASFESTAEMQSELRANYRDLADSLNAANPGNPPVIVAPVGDAWEHAGGLLPAQDPAFHRLHGADNYHGNNNGYYLAAAVFYATIYGQSPEGLHAHPVVSALGLQLTDPAHLERVAWDTVSGVVEIDYLDHPASLEVTENQTATFTARVRGSRPYTVQWFRDGDLIPDAEELSLTIPNAGISLDGSVYTVTVSNAVSSVESQPAVLSVTPDAAPPSAGEPVLTDETSVTIPFDEALDPASASDPANFSVVFRGRRIEVLSSSLSPDGRAVSLALASPIQQGFVIGIAAGVRDLAGNPMPGASIVKSPATAFPGEKVFIDFGASATQTGPADDPANTWNNVTTAIGASNAASLAPLLDSAGEPTSLRLEMIRRFNNVNQDGTRSSTVFPESATRDSLFGNTELWDGLTNVFPAFRLAGLDPLATYTLVFYASRTGVSDNRQTLYTVTGAGVSTATLNASNNVDQVAVLTDLVPDAEGELIVELSPGPQNNNAYHFTYLGAMTLEASSGRAPEFYPPVILGNQIVIDWSGTGHLEFSPDLRSPWTPMLPAPAPPHIEPISGDARFFRLSYTTE